MFNFWKQRIAIVYNDKEWARDLKRSILNYFDNRAMHYIYSHYYDSETIILFDETMIMFYEVSEVNQIEEPVDKIVFQEGIASNVQDKAREKVKKREWFELDRDFMRKW